MIASDPDHNSSRAVIMIISTIINYKSSTSSLITAPVLSPSGGSMGRLMTLTRIQSCC